MEIDLDLQALPDNLSDNSLNNLLKLDLSHTQDSYLDPQVNFTELTKVRAENAELQEALRNSQLDHQKAEQHLKHLQQFNHKLEQDLQCFKIEVTNLKNINLKFVRTIRNLQAYREYVAKLLNKKQAAEVRTKKMIKLVKQLQLMLKQKNTLITQLNKHNYVLQKTAKALRDSFTPTKTYF